jgi:N-acetylglucosaminyldiphosphoundecaprenol N-acetyl-beta-D-mannosaminyltransferase
MTFETFDILGIRVDDIDIDSLHEKLDEYIRIKAHALVLNVNVNCLNLAYQNQWLRQFLNGAEIVFCDGAGVILAARILGHHIRQRITYAEWAWQLADLAEKRGFTMYLLGAKPGIAHQAAARLLARYPDLRIVGCHHGYFLKEPGHPENSEVIREINLVKPNILITGFGMPVQEKWLYENWDNIHANIALTGGAVFDYVSGALRRPPVWLNEHGLEWFGRLLIDPSRLWRRYLLGNPLFLIRVLKHKLLGGTVSGGENAIAP